MSRKPYPLNVLTRANRILYAWEQMDTTVVIGGINRDAITNSIAQVRNIESQIQEAELKLIALRNQRDAAYVSLWDKVKRVYEGVKALYGDDSAQYEMVGRTRTSKRKPRARKPAEGT